MKKIFLFWIVSLLLLAGCETESDEWKDVGYTSVSAKIIYQEDADNTYRVYFNNEEIPTALGAGNLTLYRSELEGILQVYNTAKDSTLELEQEMTLAPEQTIQLMQLGEDPIVIVPSPDEEDTQLLENPNGTKINFYYISDTYESLTLKIYSYCNDDRTAYTHLGDVELQSGIFSDYFEVDVAQFSRELQSTSSKYRAYLVYDVYDGGQLLFEHTYREDIDVYEGGRGTNEYGFTCNDMLQSWSLSMEDYAMNYLFGATWEELETE